MRLAGENPKPRLVERLTGEDSRTWDKWCDEFEKLIGERDTAHNTTIKYRSLLKRLRTVVEPNKSAATVETLDCSKAIDVLKDAGKYRAAQQFRTFLVDSFDRMIAKGWRKDNPAAVTDRVPVKVKRGRLPFDVFMSLYRTTSVIWLRNAMALALVSGQPRECISAGRMSDIHDGGWWNERGKTGARILLPLDLRLECFGQSLDDVVKQCRATGVLSKHLIHHVDPPRANLIGKPIHIETITNAFTAELAKLKIDWGTSEPPTFHEIRSLSGRLYKAQGNVNPQELYGHRDPRTTAIYTDGRGEWIKVAVRKSTV